MTLDEYQGAAIKTAFYEQIPGMKVVYPVLGLCGEVGEVAEKIKKTFRDEGGVFTEEKKKAIALELGDVLWYLASLSRDLGFNLNEVAQMNIEKINSRKERGVTHGSGDNR